MNNKYFRKDINGLRALAVVAVFVFHFSEKTLPGGFAGVDVFFVISGFLMTGIITRGLSAGNFSFWRFMQARARRIVPALMCVILLTILVGYLLIDPANYRDIGKNGLSSLLFVSNIVYNQDVGYFEPAAEDNVFLHTWSLSVEWQFYILYALVLMLLFRLIRTKAALKWYVLAAALISFGLNIYISYYSSGSAYYLLSARAWEMLAGAAVFLFPIPQNFTWPRWPVELLGLALIVIACLRLNQNMPWPGLAALIPILGASLCLWVNNQSTLLGNWIFQAVGMISYSLYLMHWVVISIFKKLDLELSWLLYLGLSFTIAAILYHFVEKRRDFGLKTVAVFALGVLACGLCMKDGMSFRIKDPDLALTNVEYSRKFFPGDFVNDGQIHVINPGKPGEPDLILTGDSLARQYAQALKDRNLKVVTIFTDACFSTRDYISQMGTFQNRTAECLARYPNFQKAMTQYPHTKVMVAQNWFLVLKLQRRSDGALFNDDEATFHLAGQQLDALLEDGGKDRDYYFIGPPPFKFGLPVYQCLARNQLWLPRRIGTSCPDDMPLKDNLLEVKLHEWVKRHTNAHYISLTRLMCNEQKLCRIYDESTGQPLYTDGMHLSKAGVNAVIGKILEQAGIKSKDNEKDAEVDKADGDTAQKNRSR